MFAEVLLVMAGLMLITVGQWIFFDQTAPFFRDFDFHTKHEWVGRITVCLSQLGIVTFGLTQGATSHWGLALAVAYILHDVGHMLIYERDVTTYFHHIVAATVAGLMKLTMTAEQAESMALAAIVLETTGPVLHTTWLLKQAGYSSEPWFKYIAGFAAVFFGVMRCGVFPWIMAKKMDRVTALVVAPFLVMNVYWFWKILKMLKKALETKEETASNTEQSHEA
jgi:hypothetical protein